MPLAVNIEKALSAAEETAAEARDLREALRWRVRREDGNRARRIEAAIRRIDKAMRPVRQLIGGLPHYPLRVTTERRLRDVSADLQYQRKQLKKMRP